MFAVLSAARKRLRLALAHRARFRTESVTAPVVVNAAGAFADRVAGLAGLDRIEDVLHGWLLVWSGVSRGGRPARKITGG